MGHLRNPEFCFGFLRPNLGQVIGSRSCKITSKLGMEFEASADPAGPGNFDISIICRNATCRFAGVTFDKGAKFRHVAAVFFRPADPPAATRRVAMADSTALTAAAPPKSALATKPTQPPQGKLLPINRLLLTQIPVPGASPLGESFLHVRRDYAIRGGVFLRIFDLARELDLRNLPGGRLELPETRSRDGPIGFAVRLESGIAKWSSSTI